MADALIAATIEVALEKTLSLANERIGNLFQFKEDLETLKGSVAMIQAVLADAEEKQTHDQAVQLWLQRLEAVVFDAENLLDELNYEALRRQLVGKVRSFILSSDINIVFRRRMASKIRDINKKLYKINKEANDFGLIRFQRASFPPSTTAKVTLNRETDSIAGHYIVGRAKDETRLVETLLSLSEKAVSVIPILGMGGLGKTTLAQSVYKNSHVHSHFEKKIWVCVSDNFDVTRLLKMILESLTRRNVEMTSRDVIVQEIREQLVGKKIFLVLDDVWTENLTLWDDFFGSLLGLNATNGNWCVVTTRKQQTASIVATHDPYVLGKLSDDDCWSILTKKAIAGGEIPKQLHVMKKEIVKKCGGLPLAASVMGGLLRMKRKEEWQLVLKNKLSNFSGDEDGVMEILKLSFDCLPSPSIKKCFAYCSIFPKDTMMKGDMLIELWMAEGLLQADVNNQIMMEEIGMNCLRILLQSSLFEETKSYQETHYYKMHDLVHDLAESMSKSTKVINNIRYLAVDLSGGREDREKLLERLSTSLRTLFVKGDLSGDMLMKLKNLYVLNLSHATTQELPITIGKLTHLRYVNLSSSRIRILPDSLCKLYNLQTLALDGMYVKDLPKGMCNLISLRHLYFYTFDEKFQMPLEMGRLSCLQTLEFFNVGREKGRQIEELGCLKNLKGSLSVRNLQLVKDRKAAEEANLFGKANLFRLVLVWALAWDREGDNYNYDKDVLDGLRPHPNLEELVIQRFMGDQFPRWSMDLPITLPKLVRLEFYYCHRCRELIPLQNFTSLKELVIWFCRGLTNLPSDMLQSCISLQKLQVAYCDKLISFPLDLQQTPSLLELELYACPKLKTSMTPKGFGFLTSLNRLEIGPFSDDDDHENSSIYNEFDWSGLISFSSLSSILCDLELFGLLHMESLPHQIQYLTTLTSLRLHDFGGIKALPDWFRNFAALEYLCLFGFKELRHLPSEDAMRSLTKLKVLLVYGSPLLKERCTPESSSLDSQWSKISHIQLLLISD
ncbi:putative disease resistance protein RGA4 [Coffea arabica]|uniref:Disease resistance protein RGA4 n=1 Tax=Coffea arabica TaxID=13443 RepID=A0A6P6TC75_COFAR|nr:putative disease resistance protein RGA4 [Coffea arabica]XP_027076066.1 putative disease resistance protein RGA4 [Coffea arabica]XP_027076069.1 putative disease resistance protein RGA4 [Coffea arabica]XP_027076074.1 putative disease resistance protein RGA4 [Coffea arabica]XP_027076081.1 putative disease resistance protein RGA4 [Coffea arabica]XP_027076085.1 putative disease resistance protein RGA4 [Coffea arabica]